MTPAEIKSIRAALGLTQAEFGRLLGLDAADPDRAVRKWESGSSEPSGPIRVILASIVTGKPPATIRGR